jgi:hypothetical protein
MVQQREWSGAVYTKQRHLKGFAHGAAILICVKLRAVVDKCLP